MEVYRITDLIKAHNPTNLQLDVLRVKLVASMYRIELLKTNIANVNDYFGVIKSENWREITSEFRT